MLRKRSRAREVALQLMYLFDHNPAMPRAALERFVRDRLADPDSEAFALSLYDGVRRNLGLIDTALGKAAVNWRIHRMAAVDRNALRVGAFEILHVPETPPNVVLNETIELARRYGSADSPSFVNGVLDRLRKDAGK
ncbi:MAG: transcription antitermination factor NusB [Gemmataceae bacterium]